MLVGWKQVDIRSCRVCVAFLSVLVNYHRPIGNTNTVVCGHECFDGQGA